MVYSHKEVKEKFGSDYQISKKIQDKLIFKIAEGVYSEDELIDPMAVACKKYPNAIITMDSAFYYYNLTDVIPNQTHIATERHAYVIKDYNIKQYFVDKDVLEIGKTNVLIDDFLISIYDKERLLIELIRRQKQISFDYYKEIINNYREISTLLDVSLLERYAFKFSNGEEILDIIQREVF